MKASVLLCIILFSYCLRAEGMYGPMPELKDLAPQTPAATQGDLNLHFDNWYQRFQNNLVHDDHEKFEFNLRPHHEVTDRLKDKALHGDIRIHDELKRFDPTQLEGEIIIRY